MENRTVDALALGGSFDSQMTVWGLFLEADIIVKAVIVLLVLASFWSWAIIFEKVLRMRRLRALADEFEDSFWSGGSLDDLYEELDNRPSDPMAAIFVSAMRLSFLRFAMMSSGIASGRISLMTTTSMLGLESSVFSAPTAVVSVA